MFLSVAHVNKKRKASRIWFFLLILRFLLSFVISLSLICWTNNYVCLHYYYNLNILLKNIKKKFYENLLKMNSFITNNMCMGCYLQISLKTSHDKKKNIRKEHKTQKYKTKKQFLIKNVLLFFNFFFCLFFLSLLNIF